LPDESAILEHAGSAACGEFLSADFQTRHRILAALGSFLLIYQQIEREIERYVPDVPSILGNPTHTRMRMRTYEGSFKNAPHSPQMTVCPGHRLKKRFQSRHTTRHTNSRDSPACERIPCLIRGFSVVERRGACGDSGNQTRHSPFTSGGEHGPCSTRASDEQVQIGPHGCRAWRDLGEPVVDDGDDRGVVMSLSCVVGKADLADADPRVVGPCRAGAEGLREQPGTQREYRTPERRSCRCSWSRQR
jgi:hypothetical protein